jgi:hypothetical protein
LRLFRFTAALSLGFAALLMLACGSAQETTNAYTKARPGADEAATVMTLKTVASAEQTYFARKGSYATFEQMVDAGALDTRFAGATPALNGYVFKVNVAQPSATPSYTVNADPQAAPSNPATTGTRHYFMDSTGVIHYNASQAAAASDPVLQ